jgi:hypothetical protein
MNKFFAAYGSLLLIGSSFMAFRGQTFSRGDEVRNVPRSVRDNPGSYRSIYSGYNRYMGGK